MIDGRNERVNDRTGIEGCLAGLPHFRARRRPGNAQAPSVLSRAKMQCAIEQRCDMAFHGAGPFRGRVNVAQFINAERLRLAHTAGLSLLQSDLAVGSGCAPRERAFTWKL